MSIFTNINENSLAFDKHKLSIDRIIANLNECANDDDIRGFEKIRSDFDFKIKDFFRKERKLNIGVVGQVKAGKSSFLNTLLFDGQPVLPKASTPKTATLTKMEYSEENIIQIEYYSVDDWCVIEDNSTIDKDDDIYASAREIIKMTERLGINPNEYLEKGTESIKFDTYDDLIVHLNDYVGEDGKYTPLVKSVTLYLNKEEFKGLSIVDTPGLNDPIVSRTIRTKEFIEVCDVVFFLSQSMYFLDKSDWTLLSSQLPQKGVKKLVLVASKYDSGLRDVLRPEDQIDDLFGEDENVASSITKAYSLVERKLTKRAKEKIIEFVNDLHKREASEDIINIIKECNKPIMVSAMCHNMSNKPVSEYDIEEMNVYNALVNFSDCIQNDLKKIGNMSQIQQIFDEVVDEKENILTQKANSFLPTAIEELKQMLYEYKEKAEKRLSLLSNNDREQLLVQKQEMENQINGIKADIITVFGEMNSKLETEKINSIMEMRNASKEYLAISERIGTKMQTKSYKVSTSKWYNPFSWGSSRTEYYSYEEHYSYLDSSDAVNNLTKYAADATGGVEKVFTDTVQVKEMKRKLLNVVTNNFDLGSEKYDSSIFRILVEKTLNNIEFPVIKIDISKTVDKVATEFTGEITSTEQKTSLNRALTNAISKIFDEMSNKLSDSVREFKVSMDAIYNGLQVSLLENINKEFTDILSKFEDKEKEIEILKNYIDKLDFEIKKL